MAPTAFLATFDEAAFAEHREMSRDGRLVAPHKGLQITDADFLVSNTCQELEARRIGQAEADGFDRGRGGCLLDSGHAAINIYAKAYATSKTRSAVPRRFPSGVGREPPARPAFPPADG